MAKLDKMFETGELHTEKYLPAVLKEMKRQSDMMMPEYWKSLPYYISAARDEQERFMREFVEGGAETGIESFWIAWRQIVKDSRDEAEALGKIFSRVSREFAAAMIIPSDLKAWINGDMHPDNFWVMMFGDFTDSNVEGVVNNLSRIGASISELNRLAEAKVSRDDILHPTLKAMNNPDTFLDNTVREIQMITGAVASVTEWVGWQFSPVKEAVDTHLHLKYGRNIPEGEAERLYKLYSTTGEAALNDDFSGFDIAGYLGGSGNPWGEKSGGITLGWGNTYTPLPEPELTGGRGASGGWDSPKEKNLVGSPSSNMPNYGNNIFSLLSGLGATIRTYHSEKQDLHIKVDAVVEEASTADVITNAVERSLAEAGWAQMDYMN